MAEAVVTSSRPSVSRTHTHGYYRVERKHKSDSRGRDGRYISPEFSDDEARDKNLHSFPDKGECADICSPLTGTCAWPESSHKERDVDAETISLSHSTSSSKRPKKREKQSVLMAVFGPNPKPKSHHDRPMAVRRHHTTIPLTGDSMVAESIASIRSRDSKLSPRRNSNTLNILPAPSPLKSKSTPQEQSKQVLKTCITCRDDELPVQKTTKLPCGHRMCHPCIKRLFLLSTQDPQLMPPKCCTETGIPLSKVSKLFSEKFKKQWNKKYDEYTTKNRLYCPSKGCGEWIDPKHIKLDRAAGRRFGVCQKCKTRVCRKCGLRWHGARDCTDDEDTKKVIDMGKEQGWQRCYSCKAMVQLSEGCNHMKCRCGVEFCYVCGEKWKTCDCPWFNVPAEGEARAPWEDFFRVDVRRYRVHDRRLPMVDLPPLPPLPAMGFRDRRGDPLDPLDLPDMFRPFGVPPVRPERPRRPIRPNRLSDVESRPRQEDGDEALARQLQEQEIAGGLGLADLTLLEPSTSRERDRQRERAAARRVERRRRAAAWREEVQGDWSNRLRPIEVGEGAVDGV